jgi:hypothetical protein
MDARSIARVPARGRSMLVLLAALTLVVGACGNVSYSPAGGDKATPTDAAAASHGANLASFATGTTVPVPDDPCSLLTTDQLYRATSVTFPAGTKQTAGTAVECDWTQGSDSVILTIKPLDQAAFTAAMGKGVTSPQLDYPAYLDASNTIHAAKDGLDIAIQAAIRSDASAGYQAALQLMPLIFAKL